MIHQAFHAAFVVGVQGHVHPVFHCKNCFEDGLQHRVYGFIESGVFNEFTDQVADLLPEEERSANGIQTTEPLNNQGCDFWSEGDKCIVDMVADGS